MQTSRHFIDRDRREVVVFPGKVLEFGSGRTCTVLECDTGQEQSRWYVENGYIPVEFFEGRGGENGLVLSWLNGRHHIFVHDGQEYRVVHAAARGSMDLSGEAHDREPDSQSADVQPAGVLARFLLR